MTKPILLVFWRTLAIGLYGLDSNILFANPFFPIYTQSLPFFPITQSRPCIFLNFNCLLWLNTSVTSNHEVGCDNESEVGDMMQRKPVFIYQTLLRQKKSNGVYASPEGVEHFRPIDEVNEAEMLSTKRLSGQASPEGAKHFSPGR